MRLHLCLGQQVADGYVPHWNCSSIPLPLSAHTQSNTHTHAHIKGQQIDRERETPLATFSVSLNGVGLINKKDAQLCSFAPNALGCHNQPTPASHLHWISHPLRAQVPHFTSSPSPFTIAKIVCKLNDFCIWLWHFYSNFWLGSRTAFGTVT